jgi:hypothetical protein
MVEYRHWKVGDVYEVKGDVLHECVNIVPKCYLFGDGEYHDNCPGRPIWKTSNSREPFDHCPSVCLFSDTPTWKLKTQNNETMSERIARIHNQIRQEVYGDDEEK